MQVYYYFNTLRILLIFPKDEKRKKFENILENMNEFYEKENTKFNEILSKRIDNYPEIYKLINIIKNNAENSTDLIKNYICKEESICNLYLDSTSNNFHLGIEFVFGTNIIQIYNFYIDYKKLFNNTNIQEIKESLNIKPNTKFTEIMSSLNCLYVFVEQKIFRYYEEDVIFFILSFLKISNTLTNLSIIVSIFNLLFVIVLLFSISNFAGPIKDSTYRINCSFYFIKKYTLIK
jgi:hypothetical protein